MVLIVGGAGFVGSHVAKLLKKRGIEHVVLDNLSAGHRAAVINSPFRQCDITDRRDIELAFQIYRPTHLMLFAGAISVGESVKDPDKYYWDNVLGPIQVLHLAKNKLEKVVFSSSAAVYGEPDSVPIPETHPTRPKSPYGESKLVIERLLDSYAQAYGFKTVALRYFNAAGSDPDGDLGEDHDPEEHLIPLAVLAAMGLKPPLTIFGDDYSTPDGTCIRDYVHVADLAEAHLAALQTDCPPVINLGSGAGHSVRQVIATVERIAGPVPHTVGPRRPGDPARLVASNDLARRALGWKPRYTLDDMVAHAYAWRRKFPKGYAGAPLRRVRTKRRGNET